MNRRDFRPSLAAIDVAIAPEKVGSHHPHRAIGGFKDAPLRGLRFSVRESRSPALTESSRERSE